MKLPTALVKHPRLRKLLVAALVTLVLFTVLGFLVAPPIARRVAEKKLSALLHREVTIGQVRVNPYALSATVRDFRIRDRDQARDLLAFKELYANAELASLFKGGVVVKQVRLVEPAIGLVRETEDRYNFSDILDELTAPPKTPPPSPGKPTRFSVNNIEVIGGRIDLDDRVKATKHQITGINVGVPFVSNFPALVETFVQPSFAAVINGTPLSLKGRTKPFADSLESSIDVNLAKVDLPYYLAYVPMKLKFKVRSGTLDTTLKVTFSQYRDRPPKVDVAGGVAVSSLDVVDESGQPLLAFPLLQADLASSDLLESKATAKRVLLQSPILHVRRGKRGELQLQSLFAPAAPPKSQPKGPAVAKAPAAAKPAPASASAAKEKPAPPWIIEVAELKLADARVVFADRSNAQPFQTTLHPLTIDVKGFSTAKGHQAALALQAKTDAKEALAIDGKFGIDPVAFEGRVTAKGLPLPRYSPYYAAQILFDVNEGTLDAEVPLTVTAKGADLVISAADLQADLRALRLRKRGERDDFLRVPTLGVRQTSLDLAKKELVLGGVTSEGARVRLERRGKDQPWNLETLVPAGPPAAAPAPAAPAPAGPPAKPFTVLVQKLDLKGWAVRLEDRSPRSPAILSLDHVGLRVEGLGTEKGRQGRVTLQTRLNQSGAINITGTVGITPLQADVKVQLKTIPIVALQPYFADQVAVLITNGHLGANGRVTLVTLPKGLGITYKGEAGVGDVVAMDKKGVDELFRLGSVQVGGIDLRTEPFKLGIGEVALSDYVARLVVNPDKTINLAAIAGGDTKAASQPAGATARPGAPAPTTPAPAPDKPAATPAAAPAPAGPVQPIRIGALVLARGTVHVTDRSIQPAFNITLTELGGRIAGLSFEEADRADVKLDGKLGSGPIAISGKLNPLAKKIYVDLMLKLSDLDLSGMTPYAGKYVGYAIEKGQLSLDLVYQINARKLDAKNKVRIDQFTFGQSIKSKDATKLPVRLAVALLKDRKGVIQLDLPVNGSLDDPKFKVWGVILMVLKNLLVKAATSPFTLIASLFGKGEQLEWLEFQAGRYQVPEAGRGKLDSLGKALYERPGLRLEIEGHADPLADHEALKKRGVQRKVKAQRLKETVGGGVEASALDAVVVPQQEYARYLKKAFDAEKLPKPKRPPGAPKELTVAEMEQLLAATVVVSPDDLRILARQRAQVTREYLLRGGRIAPERVFMVEPKALKPAHKDKVRDSRVDFRLR